jgi:uncharacterized membrane protein
MKKKTILITVIILSLLGILTSAYLTENHYANPVEGSFCDISESVSCSLVNTSVFSELFSVPVAVFGGLWFVILALMAWKAMKKNGNLIMAMLGWNIFGLLFVFYLITVEVILGSICPFCTVVHIIVVTTLILSILLYKGLKKKPKVKDVLKRLKPWFGLILILNVLPLIIFNFPTTEKQDYTPLAKCITESGVNMYGSFRCGVCAKTRKNFGDSFQYINEIECHPQGENAQTELCVEKEIEGTPTWIMEKDGKEIKRKTGFLSMQELREFSECNI